MRALKVVGLVLLVLLVVAAVAGVIFLRSFDPNKYKKQILDQARAALQRDVDFSRIDLEISLKEGVRLRLSDVRIAEDPAFGAEDLLRVGRLRAGLDLGAFLLKRQIVVPSLSVEEMRLRVIRDKEGRLNLMALIPASAAGENSPSPIAGAPVSKALVAPIFFVREVHLTGEVAYQDDTFDAPLKLVVSQITASARDVSLTDPFMVTAQAALFADAPNVSVETKMQLDPQTAGLVLSETKAHLDLNKISQEDLRVSLPMFSAVPAWSGLAGQIDAAATRVKIGGGALVALEATAKLTQGTLAFKDAPLSLETIRAQLQATTTQVDLQEFSAKLGDGQITGAGSLKDYLSSPSYAGTVTISDVRAQELFDQSAWPARGEGVLNGSLRVEGRGFDPKAALRQLGGEGRFDVSQAKIKDFNALAFVLGKITVLPNVVERIRASLPERFKEKLTQVDTPLTSLRSTLVIANGAVRMDPIVVAAEEFSFEGKGSVGFDQTFDVTGSFSVPPDLSTSMIAGVPELKYLMDLRNRISLPVSAKGRAGGAVSVSVDAGDLAKRVLVTEGVAQLQKVLGASQEAAPASENAAAAEAPASPEKQVISQVLGALLGGPGEEAGSASTPVS